VDYNSHIQYPQFDLVVSCLALDYSTFIEGFVSRLNYLNMCINFLELVFISYLISVQIGALHLLKC
jgi:hypothetical protein